jgi:hypothetical protein
MKDIRTKELVHNYNEEMKRRRLTVILKNAIMVVWQDVKKTRNHVNMDEVIKSLSEKQKQKQDPNYLENLKKQRKERKEQVRK